MNSFYLFEPELVATYSNSSPVSDYIKSLYLILTEYLNQKGWDAKRYRIDNNYEDFKKYEVINNFLNGDKSKLPVYFINNQIYHFGSYLELDNLKEVLNLNENDIKEIKTKTQKHLSDLEDDSKNHLQDCVCV